MTTPPDDKPRRSLLAVWVAGVAAVALGCTTALVLLLQTREQALPASTGSGDSSTVQSAPLPAATRDYSTSNVVSILLGQESDDDGLRHLAEEADGRTTIETLDGAPCRYLNRKPRSFGYLYFAIDPDFKRDELKAARIEIEYRVVSSVLIRLQYDGTEGELHKRYKAAPPAGTEMMTLGAGTQYTPIRASNQWQTVTFHVTDALFMNSENGGADFRLEVTPPEIYVRRVTLTRKSVQLPLPQTNR